MNKELRILSITSGIHLLEEMPEENFNLHQSRQLEYAKYLKSYYIITRTLSKSLKPKTLAPNVSVYPTNSKNRLFGTRDILNIACDILKENKVDLISSRDPFLFGRAGITISRRLGIPLNVHVMADMIDNPFFLRERLYNRLLNYWGKKVIAGADTIRVSTRAEYRKMLTYGIPERQLFHVPFFVDLGCFSAERDDDFRKKLLGTGFDKIVLTVGRLEKQKNITMLLEVVERFIKRDARVLFIIIGSGSLESFHKELAVRMQIENNVSFVGTIDYTRLASYYRSADVFAMTSNYEGTCMVLLEAAASGLPIVSTATTGALDAIIEGNTGYIVPVEDAKEFTAKLASLLDNAKVARQMGKAGREYVLANFNKDLLVRSCIDMWKMTAGQSTKK